MGESAYERLMHGARTPQAPLTLALAGVLSRSGIAGLAADEIERLRRRHFPAVTAEDAACLSRPQEGCLALRAEEGGDLVALLLDHADTKDEDTRWLAQAVATACLQDNHLWQDMGLPSRDVLSALLKRYFRALYRKNTRNMKWKKFFYRQLCESAQVPLCQAPSCAACADFPVCFGSE
ncbi:MAG: nitrogen fixation protein NifQ [Gammaproteobacteria bacterium]|nr:nitrogen fixation protein NifQ [Gammaproteobacteria bacterium]